MDYEIIDKKLKFKNPQLVLSNSKGNIGRVSKDFIDNLIIHFEELKANEKDKYSSSELKEVHEKIRNKHVAKQRLLKKEENMGFITIGSITIVGFLIIGFIIFNIIGNIVGR